MLTQVKDMLESYGENAPAIPANVAEYLQTLFSSTYYFQSGEVDALRREGNSDTFILGFLAGLERASATIEQVINSKVVDEE